MNCPYVKFGHPIQSGLIFALERFQTTSCEKPMATQTIINIANFNAKI